MEIDCLGMRCPLPIIRLAKAIKGNEKVLLLSDDPATEPDLVAWSRMTGHSFEKLATAKYLVTRKS